MATMEMFIRGLAIGTQVLEVYFFGGLIFGFNTLVYILKKESIFSELCLNSTRVVHQFKLFSNPRSIWVL